MTRHRLHWHRHSAAALSTSSRCIALAPVVGPATTGIGSVDTGLDAAIDLDAPRRAKRQMKMLEIIPAEAEQEPPECTATDASRLAAVILAAQLGRTLPDGAHSCISSVFSALKRSSFGFWKKKPAFFYPHPQVHEATYAGEHSLTFSSLSSHRDCLNFSDNRPLQLHNINLSCASLLIIRKFLNR